ncbi:MAG: VanZ family protein [Clostridia bacterium]|nr:VanZ family protein [Clostridia bacterium]
MSHKAQFMKSQISIHAAGNSLSLLYKLNIYTEHDMNNKKAFFITILICFVYAVSDEIHQFFVPGRACRILDVLIDTLGSSFFILVCFLYSKIKIKSE